MSGRLPRPAFISVFNGAGSAGSRRLAVILMGSIVVVGGIFFVSSIHPRQQIVSRPGSLPRVDPLPGGVHSNPEQDTLGVLDNQDKAARAAETGMSYTPVMPASRPYVPQKPPAPVAKAAPISQALRTAPSSVAAPAAPEPALAPPIRVIPIASPQSPPSVIPVAAPQTPPAVAPAAVQAAQRTPQEDAAFKAALDKMMAGWGGRAPRTDVILPPDEAAAGGGPAPADVPRRRTAGGADDPPSGSSATPVSNSAARRSVLLPAGRGIYAHTILAANSDAQSPVVLQADSGPLSGDRMIGSFSRERDRLVVKVQKVIHRNQELSADGVVVAPATMEAGVASRVDQNYLERFALPAAAAFIQGLGQAIAQSNSTSVLGPLGSVTAQNKLNFDQQIGIGAGVAASQIGSELQQSTPHGPTVFLDAGSSVGVLFLSNVTAQD